MSTKPTPPRLTQADVANLLADPSAHVRAGTTAKIAAQFDTHQLSSSERQIAEDIFRVLVKDAEELVREALSAQLKSTSDLPHDVALALAQDVDSVALPMLKFSEVLTDEDLIEIVRASGSAKQVAVAQRTSISENVSEAVVNTGNAQAVARLVGNEGASISNASLDRVIEEFQDAPAVADSLARRSNLPPTISERVVTALSERLENFLIAKHEISPDVASNLVLQTRERATMNLVDFGSSDSELDKLVEQLHRRGRLTASLLLRALCVGDLNFFERAVACLTGLPIGNVRILIHDKGMLGLEPLYLRAKLPKTLFPAFRAAVQLVVESDYDGGPNDRERYIERLLERMLTQFNDPATRIAPNDIEYLMAKLRQIAA